MDVKKFVLGELETNTYLISDDNSNAYIIDPAEISAELSSYIKDNKLELRGVILTHFHLDHIKGIVQFPNAPIYICKEDASYLKDDALDVMRTFYSYSFIDDEEINKLKGFIQESKIIEISDGFVFPSFFPNLEAIQTKGHSSGSICIYIKDSDILFTGDTLFYYSHGRVDLIGGNATDMKSSLRKLSCLPDKLQVFPGHGDSTNIGIEKKYGVLFQYAH